MKVDWKKSSNVAYKKQLLKKNSYTKSPKELAAGRKAGLGPAKS
jgi:hypothetical protein